MSNPYVKFVKEYREKNPSLSYKEAMVEASKEYKKSDKSPSKSKKVKEENEEKEENITMEIEDNSVVSKMTKAQRTKLIKEFNKIKKGVMEELKSGTLDKSSELYMNFLSIGKTLKGKSKNNVYAKALAKAEKGMTTKTFQKAKDRQVKKAEGLLQLKTNKKGKKRGGKTGKQFDKEQSRDNRIRDKVGRKIREEIEKGNNKIDIKGMYKSAEEDEKKREEQLAKVKNIDVNMKTKLNRTIEKYSGAQGKATFVNDYRDDYKRTTGKDLSYKQASKLVTSGKIYVNYMDRLKSVDDSRLEGSKLEALVKVLGEEDKVYGATDDSKKDALLTAKQRSDRLMYKNTIMPIINKPKELFYELGGMNLTYQKLQTMLGQIDRILGLTKDQYLIEVKQRVEELQTNIKEVKKKYGAEEKTQGKNVEGFLKEIQGEAISLTKTGKQVKKFLSDTKDMKVGDLKGIDNIKKLTVKMGEAVKKVVSLQDIYDKTYDLGTVPLSKVGTVKAQQKFIKGNKGLFEKLYDEFRKVDEANDKRNDLIDNATEGLKKFLTKEKITKEDIGDIIPEPVPALPDFEFGSPPSSGSSSGASSASSSIYGSIFGSPTGSGAGSPLPTPPSSPPTTKKKTKAEEKKEFNDKARNDAMVAGKSKYKNFDGKMVNVPIQKGKGKKKKPAPAPAPAPAPTPAPAPAPAPASGSKKYVGYEAYIHDTHSYNESAFWEYFKRIEEGMSMKDSFLKLTIDGKFPLTRAQIPVDLVAKNTNPSTDDKAKEPSAIAIRDDPKNKAYKDIFDKSLSFIKNAVANKNKMDAGDKLTDLDENGYGTIEKKAVTPAPAPAPATNEFKTTDMTKEQRDKLLPNLIADWFGEKINDVLVKFNSETLKKSDYKDGEDAYQKEIGEKIVMGVGLKDNVEGNTYNVDDADTLALMKQEEATMGWKGDFIENLDKMTGDYAGATVVGEGFANMSQEDTDHLDKTIEGVNKLYHIKVNGGNLMDFAHLPAIQNVGKMVHNINHNGIRKMIGGHLEDVVMGEVGNRPLDKIEHHLEHLEEIKKEGGSFEPHIKRISQVARMIGNIPDEDTKNMYGKSLEDIVL